MTSKSQTSRDMELSHYQSRVSLLEAEVELWKREHTKLQEENDLLYQRIKIDQQLIQKLRTSDWDDCE